MYGRQYRRMVKSINAGVTCLGLITSSASFSIGCLEKVVHPVLHFCHLEKVSYIITQYMLTVY